MSFEFQSWITGSFCRSRSTTSTCIVRTESHLSVVPTVTVRGIILRMPSAFRTLCAPVTGCKFCQGSWQMHPKQKATETTPACYCYIISKTTFSGNKNTSKTTITLSVFINR